MATAASGIRVILADLDRVLAALAALAARHRDTPMAGRTLMHAVPVTFGLKAATWLAGIGDAARDLGRLLDVELPVQLGGAAGTLAGYVEPVTAADRPELADALLTAFATETGLAAPSVPWHTTRGPIAKLGAALAVTIGALGKMAVDVQTLTRTEIAEAAEPHATGRGASSAMPQKRNPVSATLIRAAALQAPAHAATLLTAMLAEDERPAGAWHAEWQPLRELLLLAGGAAHTAAELAEGLTVGSARMAENLRITAGGVVAERIAAALIPVIGRAEAKRVVSKAAAAGGDVVDAIRESVGPVDLDLAALADPRGYLGVAGHLVDRAVAEYSELADH